MACLRIRALMALPLMCSIPIGLCRGTTATCRPFCIGTDCLLVIPDRVDFTTARQSCRAGKGELMTFQSAGDERLLDVVRQELGGSFWIGLHLPTGACSSLSAPMRGYEWTSGGGHSHSLPSLITWKDAVRVCSPRCVSLSNGHRFTERPCSERTDGFLCRSRHKDACQAGELSDGDFFRSSKGCSDGPCEQNCTDVNGGFRCSCFRGFAPDRMDPRRCAVHCARERCPAVCERNSNDGCLCPPGFILNGKICEDIDECLMDGCDQGCKNTFGSFYCSCKDGYVLKDQVKCVQATEGHLVLTTPSVKGYAKPDNRTRGSSATTGTFIWLWIVAALCVVVFICVVRLCVVRRQKRREQSSHQMSGTAAGNS
ncbi:thrombomodulin-like [Nerophis ophidion]|uniref:thrombomodulin-like n=1 Tax=Nerophis ophidion TaxID=159077 RepID=UPI002AE02BB9|nr:thrombomodulin-like [Nerophis ophidion]